MELACQEVQDCSLSSEVRQVVVPIHLHGTRLDKALVDLVPEFSRSYLQQLLESGHIALNGAYHCKPSTKVKAADALSVVLIPTAQSQAFRPEPMALEVVFEDHDVLVINKPAGLVVHPAPGNWSGTLLNALLARDPAFSLVPRAGIVHRLDKDTSGLMVVARHREAMDRLVHALSARQVSRQYIAIAQGQWSGSAMRTVDAPIGRDPRNRLRMGVVDLAVHAGKLAQTDVHWLANGPHGCLVRCVLHTGRTHQIRVHMASIGHPLVGDSVYGVVQSGGIARQALHAVRLAFDHPMSAKPLVFTAPVPTDMCVVMDAWGVLYNDSM